MKDALKIFDADAHAMYPADLWSRFFDKKHQHRVGRVEPLPGKDAYNPVTIDGEYTQHNHNLYRGFLHTIDWNQEAWAAKDADCMATGFRGDKVSEALKVEGIDCCVIYGPEYDL